MSTRYLTSEATRTRYTQPIYGRKTITIAGLPFSGQRLAADTLKRNFEGILTRDYEDVSNGFYYDIKRIFDNPEWLQPLEKTNVVLLNTMAIEKIFGFPPKVVGKIFNKWYERMQSSYNEQVMKRVITEDAMKISKLIRYGIIAYNAADLDGQLVLYHPCCTDEFCAGKDTFKIWVDCDLDYCIWHATKNGYKFDRKFYSQNYIDKLMPMRNCADILVPNYEGKQKFVRDIIKLGKELHLEEKPDYKKQPEKG